MLASWWQWPSDKFKTRNIVNLGDEAAWNVGFFVPMAKWQIQNWGIYSTQGLEKKFSDNYRVGNN